jgi:hypothetical protein
MGAMDPAAAKIVADVLSPTSYAELLQPIPNAVALLKTADEMEAAARASQAGEPGAQTQLAQYWYHHHHHHHHNNYWRRRYYHHHHHHHHHWRYHHHHHHHNYYPY